MFRFFKKKIKKVVECRSRKCKQKCQACKLESLYKNPRNRYELAAMQSKSPDYETVVQAFRATRYNYGSRWTPEILGVYDILGNSPNNRHGGMLLYFGMQQNEPGDFLLHGFNKNSRLANCRNGRVVLTNRSFAAVTYDDVITLYSCDCVKYDNEVVYVVLCEVPNPKECREFVLKPQVKGLHPFEKYKGMVSMKDNCHFRDSLGRGLNKGYFPCKMDGHLKGLKFCDEFLVDEKLVKPVYMVAVRFQQSNVTAHKSPGFIALKTFAILSNLRNQ